MIIDWKNNLWPSLLQTSRKVPSTGFEEVWLVWQKTDATAIDDIYLMIHNGFGWSGQIPLVVESSHDVTPTLVELKNGTIMMVWPSDRGGNYDLYTKSYTNGQWTPPTPLVQAPGDDFNPSMTRDDKGRVWLVWSRATATNGPGDIYYRIFNGLSWEPEKPLATGPKEEKFPTITQTRDGKIWVVWQSNGSGTARLWYKTFNGIVWTDHIPLTSTTNPDKWPSITQDRSGTIWVFWARELSTNDPLVPFQWELYYKTSTNNGASWTPDTSIAQETGSDDWHPSIVQGKDRRLWVAWNSDRPSQYGTHNIYMINTDAIIIHDLAVSLVIPQDKPRSGETFAPTVQVRNVGDYSENVALTVTVDGTSIGTGNTVLAAGQTATFPFTWPTADKSLGQHVFNATIAQVPSEANRFDNTVATKFHIVLPGDVQRDGPVDVTDLAAVGAAFGSKIGDPQYNPNADLNGDGTINVQDLAILGSWFGQRVTLPPDFFLGASPYYPRVVQGSSTSITIIVGSISGLNSTLLLTASGFGPGVTARFSKSLVIPTTTSVLTVTANSTATIGSYTITIKATNGTFTRSLDIYLAVKPPPDFALSSGSSAMTVLQGGTADTTITLSSSGDFNSPVTLTTSSLPAGVSAVFNPNPATPPANGITTSTLTFTATSTATQGTFPVTITGTSGSLIRSAAISLTVKIPPDFNLAATPSTLSIVQGSSSSSTITVSSIGGYNDPTSLSVSGLPTGVTATFSANPITPPGDSTASSILTFTAAASTPVGTYSITVSATNGTLTHTTSISLTVKLPPDFTISASPSSLTVIKGSSGTVTVTVTSIGDFSQPVTLTTSALPSGVSASFAPNPVTPPANEMASSTLTLTAASSATQGTFTITISGSDGSIVHSITISLTVSPPPDFGLGASPTSLTIIQGSSGTVTVTVTSTGGFNSPVTLSTSALPSGVTASFSPNPVTPPADASATSTLTLSASSTATTGTFTITISGTSGGLTRSTTISLTVSPSAPSASDATIIYAGGTPSSTPRERTWDGTAWTSETSLSDSGSTIRWVRTAYSTSTSRPSEKIVVTLSADGYLDAYVWNGNSWSVTSNIAFVGTTANAYRSFDLVYERTAGRALLAYSSGGGAADIGYLIWDGASWLGPFTLDFTASASGSRINWVSMAAKPIAGSDEIALIAIDGTNSDVYGAIWNGASWSSQLQLDTTVSITTEEAIAVEYEQLSGFATFVWGVSTDNNAIKSRQWSGTAWDAGAISINGTNGANDPNWIVLAADPVSDRLMLLVIDGGSDLNTASWDGSVWTVHTEHDSSVNTNANRAGTVAWEPSGSKVLLVWATDTTNLSYKTWTPSVGWTATSTFNYDGADGRWVQARTDPRNLGPAKILVGVSDINLDLFVVRWDGTALVRGVTATTSLPTNLYESFDIRLQVADESATGPLAPAQNETNIVQSQARAAGFPIIYLAILLNTILFSAAGPLQGVLLRGRRSNVSTRHKV